MSDTATPLNPIAAALAAAREQSAAHVAAQAGAVATVQQHQAPAPYAPPGRAPALTMDDLKAGSITVDGWLGVKEHGFVFGTDKALSMEEMEVMIDLTTVAPCFVIKAGNPAVYWKSYDRVTEGKGGPWHEAVARANRVDPNAREYRSCEIPFVITKDVVIKGKEYAKLGQTFGHSLSTTNWANWEKFWGECSRKGLTQGVVKVKLGYEKRTNAKNNIWGVVTFTLMDA